ncbi:thiamine phosphate synthase [Heliobacterium gestii]|uniref:Thiamine-phosphate synthase n=1 Tax=Heliomicrobium gestii TaxID=2699 RepID=A0A845LAY3_HELGE|nr:thiamine phosphate synthase [Heliomicrobium gestii]MBM7868160.1 thiamine-phosphate pyrophosphorylase [Heliomicrobium gestii]MZP43358.1 thiamine phosphate synthase [Heliomicrobium gestii]
MPEQAGGSVFHRDVPWIYLVTDRRACGGRSFFHTVEAALRGGVNIVQYREKAAGTGQMVEEAQAIHDLCRRYGALFVVNDRIDVAMAVNAPAVHLGQEDMPLAMARRILGADVCIGISASSVEEAIAAEQAGADYVGASAVFTTPTKAEAPGIGLEGLAAICRAISIPVVGIGGLHAGNAAAVVAAGGRGVAVVSAIMSAGDPEQAARGIAAEVARTGSTEASQ